MQKKKLVKGGAAYVGCSVLLQGKGRRFMSETKHYNSAKHKAWAEKVIRKAGYLCQRCKRYGKKTPATIAHHIKHIDEYPELAFKMDNGMAVCARCHNELHPEKGAPHLAKAKWRGARPGGGNISPQE